MSQDGSLDSYQFRWSGDVGVGVLTLLLFAELGELWRGKRESAEYVEIDFHSPQLKFVHTKQKGGRSRRPVGGVWQSRFRRMSSASRRL